MIAGSGRAFIDQLAAIPEFMQLLEAVFPGVDIASLGASSSSCSSSSARARRPGRRHPRGEVGVG